MFRFGCALQLKQIHADFVTSTYARCVCAHHAGLGVVRISGAWQPCPASPALTLLQDYIHTHRQRIVIHASFADIAQLTPQLHAYASLFVQLACADGIIICHVPRLDAMTATVLRTLDPQVRRYVALEHTHQPPDAFVAFADNVGMPPIFDWLHYHIQAPWPYQPVDTARSWAQRWGARHALIHMSSPSERGSHGAHGARIDSSDVAWLLRTFHMHGMTVDIELETPGGIPAYHRLRHELATVAPDVATLIAGDIHAHTI